jgi:Zn-dependent metalloprotease
VKTRKYCLLKKWPGSLIAVILLVAAIALIAGIYTGVRAHGQPEPSAGDPQAVALEKLRGESKQPLKVRFEAGIPRFVSVRAPVPAGVPDDPVIRALDFLERNRDLYRIQDPASQLYLERSVINESGQHLFFGQRRHDVAVFGSQLAVHLSEGAVIATNGNYLTDIPQFPPPVIDEMRAEKIALKKTGSGAIRIGEPKLIYFSRRLFMTPAELAESRLDSDTHQAWRLMTALNSEGDSWSYLIDAQTGAILYASAMSPTHAPQKDFNIRTANNAGETLFCGFATPTDWFDENGVLPGATPDTEGNSAFASTHKVYDYFYNNFHQHSWNGDEDTIRLILDDADPRRVANAAYVRACSHFVFGNNMASLDVIAHEITHGVTHKIGGNFITTNQPGALNESYSDVFAMMIDAANFTIGEGTVAGVVRSLSAPPSVGSPGDPDHMLANLSGDGLGLRTLAPGVVADCNFASPTFNDCGFIHTNCGITNKAAFLITMGGSHNGITVNGLGRRKAAKLYYDVLTSWITNNADFNSARDVTVAAAMGAAMAGRDGFTSADVCTVVNAFASVGLGLPDLDCDGVDDNADTDDDGDFIGDRGDNCPMVSNPGQEDSDHDGIGDACDTDDDNDGVQDAADNCSRTPNPGQGDKDRDGIGDVCDDTDLDGVLDSVDNCWAHPNPSQSDFDGDGIGDVCDVDDDNDGICDLGGPVAGGTPGTPPGGCPSRKDNCPRKANSSQIDSDNDGIGDACDMCPGAADSGIDTDGDGVDDVCDPDDDNDGVVDQNDNCPTVRNPNQQDVNLNGIGTACDPDEALNLGSSPAQFVGAVQFRRERFERFQIMILPDIHSFGRDWIPQNFVAKIKVQLDTESPLRIVDDQGFVITQAQAGRNIELRFRPKPDFYYRPPGSLSGVKAASSEAPPYLGRRYFLEIFPPTRFDPGRSYKIYMNATTGIEP